VQCYAAGDVADSRIKLIASNARTTAAVTRTCRFRTARSPSLIYAICHNALTYTTGLARSVYLTLLHAALKRQIWKYDADTLRVHTSLPQFTFVPTDHAMGYMREKKLKIAASIRNNNDY